MRFVPRMLNAQGQNDSTPHLSARKDNFQPSIQFWVEDTRTIFSRQLQDYQSDIVSKVAGTDLLTVITFVWRMKKKEELHSAWLGFLS
ncbi:hypothetical protein FKM82_005184 [Ascaphus truei]